MLSNPVTISTSLRLYKFQSLHKSCHIKPSLTLRPVTQGKDELQGKRTKVQPLESKVDPVRNHGSTEEEERRGLRIIREKIDDDTERKPQVGKGEPGEDKGEGVILQAQVPVSIIPDSRCVGRTTHQGLDVEEEHPNNPVARLVHIEEVNERVYARRETTVEPAATLPNELRRRLRHVGFCLAGLDISQSPGVIGFCDELETEDTILGQEHVLWRRVRTLQLKTKRSAHLGEDVHPVDTLLTQTVRHGVITVEVLIQGSPENSTIAVGREGTR